MEAKQTQQEAPNSAASLVPPVTESNAESTSAAAKTSTANPVSFAMNLEKNMKRKSSGTTSGGSNGGSGNSSDNSGHFSLGNHSFGFNFDPEEGMINSQSLTTPGESDSDGKPEAPPPQEPSHAKAAAEAVANLQSIASSFSSPQAPSAVAQAPPNLGSQAPKTPQHGDGTSDTVSTASAPQHSVDSGTAVVSLSSGATDSRPRKKAKKLDDNKREERNAREKERSFRISRQINELRNLLSSGGVIVPKGTKSSVLTEAANYIRMLQQHQYRSEIDRHQLVQQMQMIGGGALGPQAASAVRHVAAQNGVWSLGNFGGVPPKSAMSIYQGHSTSSASEPKQPIDANAPLQTKLENHDYRFVFNSCAVGLAIASMGGAFIDCNQLFCQLSNYSKQEICSMTIFNLTSRQDLQHAFDLISQMISPPTDGRQQQPSPCVLRGAMKSRHDLGLSVALIKGDDGIAKCFCVTLIKNPASPFDASRSIPATADQIIPSAGGVGGAMSQPPKDGGSASLKTSPAYTSG